MKKQYKFESEEKVFLFVLEDINQNGKKDGNKYPLISCLLYRTDSPDFDWTWKGHLKPLPEKIEFHLVYEDQINFKGYIHLFESQGASNQDYIFMDAQYGIQYEEHFEGNVFEIGASTHNHPSPPEIVTIADSNSSTIPPTEIISGDGYKDLFPYLYLQYWPDVQKSDEIFFIPIPSTLKSYAFYKKLLDLLESKTPRASIEKEALRFINGKKSYAGEFIQTVEDLPFPFQLFVEIYDELYRGEPVIVEDLLERVQLDDPTVDTDTDPLESYKEEIQRIWGNIVALTIIEGYDLYTFEQLSKILIINNLLDYIAEEDVVISQDEIQQLLHASIVLTKPLFPLPAFEDTSDEIDIYTGTIVPYAIGDLQLVQHQIRGYQLGDLARIENVMAGELKKFSHRKRAINNQEDVQNKLDKTLHNQAEQSDALERQVTKIVADILNDKFTYNDLEVSYGPPTSGTYKGSVSQDKTLNTTTTGPIDFAKRILANSVNQIDQHIGSRRLNILRNETDESTTNLIENRQNNKNLRGIYHWLNKVYHLRLINYGHRFLLEFVINKPAFSAMNSGANPIPIRPIAPSLLPTNPITSFKDITPENYLDYALIYNINNLPLPPASNNITTAMIKGDQLTSYTEMKVPNGYFPELLVVNYNIENKVILLAGNSKQELKPNGENVTISNPLTSLIPLELETSYSENLVVPVAVNTAPTDVDTQLFTPYFVNLILTNKVTNEKMNRWKQEIYSAIQNGYQEQLQAYRLRMIEQFEHNPSQANQLIEKSIKSACIQLLWQQHLKINGTSKTSISPSEDTVNMLAFIQFFEIAFEWDKMVYTLDQNLTSNTKADLIKALNDIKYADKVEQFLEANEARVLLPIDSNYNYKMMYYLSAGQVFYGEDHLTPIVTANESIALKIKEVFELSSEYEIRELECWDEYVPTEMQWLSEDSNTNIFCK